MHARRRHTGPPKHLNAISITRSIPTGPSPRQTPPLTLNPLLFVGPKASASLVQRLRTN